MVGQPVRDVFKSTDINKIDNVIVYFAGVILTLVVYLTVKAISQTAYDEVPVPDVCPLFWWLWVIQFFNYMNLVEYATALAWVQFAEEKKRAHAANRVSIK